MKWIIHFKSNFDELWINFLAFKCFNQVCFWFINQPFLDFMDETKVFSDWGFGDILNFWVFLLVSEISCRILSSLSLSLDPRKLGFGKKLSDFCCPALNNNYTLCFIKVLMRQLRLDFPFRRESRIDCLKFIFLVLVTYLIQRKYFNMKDYRMPPNTWVFLTNLRELLYFSRNLIISLAIIKRRKRVLNVRIKSLNLQRSCHGWQNARKYKGWLSEILQPDIGNNQRWELIDSYEGHIH